MTKVYIINGNDQYVQMWKDQGFQVVNDYLDADVLQFTGGADVDPVFYGERNKGLSYSNIDRDYKEQKLFHWALQAGIPCVGICRGGQALNCFNGGRMHQHVEKHTRDHDAILAVSAGRFNRGDVVKVTSTHHQMFRPNWQFAELLLYAELGANPDGQLDLAQLGEHRNVPIDIEAVFYERTKSLCFQPHPEFADQKCIDLYFEFVKKYLKITP